MAESSWKSEKPPYGCENSIGRLLALRSVTKVPLTPYLEQFTDLAKASKEY